MSAFLDELYFNWLYDQVCSPEADDPSQTYVQLFHILYTKEFVWLVPNDDNRLEDGTDLRHEFLVDQEIELKPSDGRWMELECSVLELLIGLARRFGFIAGRPHDDCFWEMLDNVKLSGFNDASDFDPAAVEDILDQLIWRNYESSGRGGLFPLENARHDQRDVELWYQLNAYLIERM